MTTKTTRGTIATGLLVGAIACSADEADGKGTITFTTWGEEFIEQAIPAVDADGTVVVEDGWTITFDKFLVVIADVSVAEEGKPPVVTFGGSKLFDMHAPGEKVVASFSDVPAKAYTNVSWATAPATGTTEIGPGATEADRAMMVEKGYSIWVSATATKG